MCKKTKTISIIVAGQFMRAWFNGRMGASQALDEGSIPFARFFKGKI